MIPQPPPGSIPDPYTLGPMLARAWMSRSYVCPHGGYWIVAVDMESRQWVTAGSDRYGDAGDALRARIAVLRP